MSSTLEPLLCTRLGPGQGGGGSWLPVSPPEKDRLTATGLAIQEGSLGEVWGQSTVYILRKAEGLMGAMWPCWRWA